MQYILPLLFECIETCKNVLDVGILNIEKKLSEEESTEFLCNYLCRLECLKFLID